MILFRRNNLSWRVPLLGASLLLNVALLAIIVLRPDRQSPPIDGVGVKNGG